MTTEVLELPGGPPAEPEPEAELVGEAEEQAWAPAPKLPTVGAAAASAAGAAWMVGGLFRGWEPRLVTLGGVAIGIGVIAAGYRLRRDWVQYLALPIGAVVGAALVAPSATGGSASVPALIVEAIRQGGLSQPPVPFDPGWRFLLLLAFALLAAAAAAVGVGDDRPKLAVLVPIPLAVGAALVQPPDSEITTSIVAAVLLCCGLVLAQGAELGRRGQLGLGFEGRRILRGGAMLVGLILLLVVLSQSGLLFPQPDLAQVIPPQKPQLPPPAPDRPLFEVRSALKVPLRLGVIDIYDARQNAWLLPPYDSRRLHPLKGSASFTGFGQVPKSPAKTFTVDFQMDEQTGHQVPDIGGMVSIKGIGTPAEYDPRTQTLTLDDRVFKGLRYRVTAEVPPVTQQLETAPAPPSSLDDFLQVPPAPRGVLKLLANAPSNPYDRLQYLRSDLLSKVVAAGVGRPADLPVAKVDDMLNGGEATPYQITAAEALLARWAGVPSRIGYGYYGGISLPDGSVQVRPRHGSTWLEAYFQGLGWVPIVGTPQQAKPTSNAKSQTPNPDIKPSSDFDLVVYVPSKQQTLLAYYDYVRYWFLVALPVVFGLLLLIFLYPAPIKLARRSRRRQWARSRGPLARTAVAYAELRDTCRDLMIGDPAATPLEFLLALQPDAEHQELAWLVTRAWWGDVQRDLRDEDAQAAERLAASVQRRLLAAQTPLNRILALAARSSLVEPYTDEVPNLWRRSPWSGLAGRLRGRLRSLLSLRRRLALERA